MKIQIKSQDGITTFFTEGQVMSVDEATNSLVITALITQADTKEFVNPETIFLPVTLSAECTSMLLSEITQAYNAPKKVEEQLEDVK